MLKRDKDFDILASLFVCSMQFSNSKVILSCCLLNWSGKTQPVRKFLIYQPQVIDGDKLKTISNLEGIISFR